MPSKMARGMLRPAVLAAALWAGAAFGAEAGPAPAGKARPDVEGEAEAGPAALAFELSRSDDLKTRLNGHEIWYKGRLPSKAKATVWAKQAKDGALLLGVSKFDRETDAEGPRRFLRFDAQAFDERIDGKRAQYLEAGASPADDLGLKRLVALPWYELARADGGAWLSETRAEGEAWPLADGMDLGREAALVLPQASFADFAKGRGVKVRCALPFPAPLAPAPEATVAYTLRDVTGSGNDRLGTIEVSGSNAVTPKGGVAWGGIRVKGAEIRSTVEGTLKIVLATNKVLEGRVKIDVAVRKTSASETFESVFKAESVWRAADGR
ncbi:MAG: hypothetical protein KIS92_10245 [Planctomycetota bacterium]|nr:hypothetical protein [Planctomycetota bacterium]